jgi:hypothetical protein
MAVEARTNHTNYQFILSGSSNVEETATVAQDAGRTADLAKYTLMAQVPATQKWTPWIDETATDGTEFPMGIILASVATADLVAGDIADVPILTGDDISVDKDQLVFDAAGKTLATVIGTLNLTVEQWLQLKGITPEATMSIDEFENA